MGVPLTTASQGLGDMLLMVQGARNGVIKGESKATDHDGEIDVLGWSWGMEASPGLGGGPQKRATVRDLKVVKRVDKASTALMQALRTNEPITKAVLTLRKAGGTQLEFLKITIEEGRVVEVSVDADATGPQLLERVRFSFNKINVEYTPQGPDGQKLGSSTYADQFSPS